MRGVFDHAQVIGLRETLDFVHVARLSGQMHRHNGAGMRRYAPAGIRYVYIHRERIDIHQYRTGAEISNDLCRRRECVSRNQNFIAGLKADAFAGQVESRCAGGNRDGVACPDEAGELTLKLHRFRPHSHPATTKDLGNSLYFLIADAGPMERDLEIEALGVSEHSVSSGTYWDSLTSISIFCER